MHSFAQAADRIAATTKKLEKTALLAEYLRSVPIAEAAIAAVFFSGRPFPAWEETTLRVGGSTLWRVVSELSGRSESELTAAYREYGDLGAVAGAVLPDRRPDGDQSPSAIHAYFRELATARGPTAKGAIVRQLLSEITPLEAKYVIKIMTGDLRIGLKESLVEEAIAKAFGAPADGKLGSAKLNAVQRANMLLGDIGETLKLAAEGRLAEAKMRLFHPIGFMLASPAESAEDALAHFQNPWVEDKYDGIRAQAHCSGNDVRFFSRTRDEITESFPELPDALAGLPQDAILDGEIVAWSYLDGGEPAVASAERSSLRDLEPSAQPTQRFRAGLSSSAPAGLDSTSSSTLAEPSHVVHRRSSAEALKSRRPDEERVEIQGRALPFSALQQRLGRKKVSEKLMRDVPVAYIVFDVFYAGDELMIDRPLKERGRILGRLLADQKTVHHGDTETRRKRTRSIQGNLNLQPLADDRGPTTDGREPTTMVIRAPILQASSPDELNQLFDAAQARGNEGLMIKDPESPYTPGRRGKSWLKLKRELGTLDVVVTAAEYGHGKRIGVLSDYTFAVRDGDRLLNIGKAYSGLTDAEIAKMTKWFLDHTVEDQGFRRIVEPKIVLEVVFNNVMKSERHSSGYALRFPRIVRLRPDKLPEEADTLKRAKEIYEKQALRHL
jgi:DNA ligase-1